MSLRTEEAIDNATKEATREEIAPCDSDKDDNSSSASEDIAPSLKRQNQKRTPPKNTDIRKSLRNSHSALASALGNPVSVNTIRATNTPKTRQFEIVSPPEKSASENYPSLKSLIEEMAFTEKNTRIQNMCEICRSYQQNNEHQRIRYNITKQKTRQSTNSMEIVFVKQKNDDTKETQEEDDEQLQDVEEHGTNIDDNNDTKKDGTRVEAKKETTRQTVPCGL